MNESILQSIKKLLGISYDDTQFDQDIIIHINSVFASLSQIGIGPEDGFAITSDKEIWSDFIGSNKIQQMVVTYTYIRVRLVFDPPTSSIIQQSMKDEMANLEWRLGITVN